MGSQERLAGSVEILLETTSPLSNHRIIPVNAVVFSFLPGGRIVGDSEKGPPESPVPCSSRHLPENAQIAEAVPRDVALQLHIRLVQFGQNRAHRRVKGREVSRDDQPHRREVHFKVVMDQNISHASYGWPVDLRVPLFVQWLDALRRFAEHLKVANDCILECA
jgi:hypothetical protein